MDDLKESEPHSIRATVHLTSALRERAERYLKDQAAGRMSFSQLVTKTLTEFLDRKQ
jgi:hypothetical protein